MIPEELASRTACGPDRAECGAKDGQSCGATAQLVKVPGGKIEESRMPLFLETDPDLQFTVRKAGLCTWKRLSKEVI
jgi:hypothetical protein